MSNSGDIFDRYKAEGLKHIPKGWEQVTGGNIRKGDLTWKPALRQFTKPSRLNGRVHVSTVYCCIRKINENSELIGSF